MAVLHVGYRAKFGWSGSNGVGIIGGLKLWNAWIWHASLQGGQRI